MRIEDLLRAITGGRIRVSDHADQEANDDRLSYDEIAASVMRGEIIEDYPQDRPYPSCLVYGENEKGEPIHSVWAYNEGEGAAVLITVYRPDPRRWLDWRTRRR